MVASHISSIRKFIEEDLWKIKLQSLSKRKSFLYRQIRIWVIAISEFIRDRCSEKASALTYFSLLSIVPVAAMAFGIATIFGLEEYLKRELTRYLAGQEEVLNWTLEFAGKMLSTSSGGLISGISAAFLIYAVARLFSNIENAFNGIWDTRKGRSLKRMITDYMSVILLGPLILILSSSTTVFITTQIEHLAQGMEFLGPLKSIILFLIKLIPYTLIWFLLFLVYMIFPNTSVKVKPALIAGIVAGTAYQLTQLAWIEGQVYLSRYSVVYGSFAALPLFLIWLQLSWTILLFGAEYAFAIQNVSSWSYQNDQLNMSPQTKRAVTFLVLLRVVQFFNKNDDALSFEQLCAELNTPRRFVREVVNELEKSRLIVRLATDDDSECFQPGIDVHKLDIYTALKKLETTGMQALPSMVKNEGFQEIEVLFNELDRTIKTSECNKKVIDL